MYTSSFFYRDQDDSEVFLERYRTVSENELDISGMEQLHQIPDNSQAEESWENLHEVGTCLLYTTCSTFHVVLRFTPKKRFPSIVSFSIHR